MVPNEKLRRELYEQCYFRLKWCGTVNPLGAFHCEIAASIALLMGSKGGELNGVGGLMIGMSKLTCVSYAAVLCRRKLSCSVIKQKK